MSVTLDSLLVWHQGPLLVIWVNFNPSINNYIHYKVWDEVSFMLIKGVRPMQIVVKWQTGTGFII